MRVRAATSPLPKHTCSCSVCRIGNDFGGRLFVVFHTVLLWGFAGPFMNQACVKQNTQNTRKRFIPGNVKVERPQVAVGCVRTFFLLLHCLAWRQLAFLD